MKAHINGTVSDQARHKMGWRTATENRIAGGDPKRRCATCLHFNFLMKARGDGGFSALPVCQHVDAAGEKGHATRESSVCHCWSPKP